MPRPSRSRASRFTRSEDLQNAGGPVTGSGGSTRPDRAFARGGPRPPRNDTFRSWTSSRSRPGPQTTGEGENDQRTETPRGIASNPRRRRSIVEAPSTGSCNGSGHFRALRPQRGQGVSGEGSSAPRTHAERSYALARIRVTHRAPAGVEQPSETGASGPEESRTSNSTPSPWATRSADASRSRNAAVPSNRGSGREWRARRQTEPQSVRGAHDGSMSVRATRERTVWTSRRPWKVDGEAPRHSQVAGTPPRVGARSEENVVARRADHGR